MPRLAAYARTHTGRRASNEDAWVCRVEAGLFAVIDGMGGREAGEVAAAIAANTLAETPTAPGMASETLLVHQLHDARERILAHARANPPCAGMGAAATAVRLDDDGTTASLAHVGDTRAWHVGPTGIVQLTRDHVGARDDGRPALSRDLGREDLPESWVDTSRVSLAAGDLLVLASDGLYDALGTEGLARALHEVHTQGRSARAASRVLMRRAIDAGAHDNVTVIVVRAGTWRRGAPTRTWWAGGPRLSRPVALAVFALLGALALAAATRDTRETHAVRLTGSFDGAEERMPDRATLEGTLRITAGARLTVRGAALSVRGGTVILEDGATLVLRRSVVDGDALPVTMGRDALLVLEDTSVSTVVRVAAATGAADARVELARVVADREDAVTLGEGVARGGDGPLVRGGASSGHPTP